MVMPTATIAVNSMDPQVLACQVGSWTPVFASQALRSVVLDLPDDFITYLHADGVFVPEKSEAVSTVRCSCCRWSLLSRGFS